MVIVVEGSKSEENSYTDIEIIDLVNDYIGKGMSKKDAIESISAAYKIRKNYIKDLIK